MDWFTVHPVFIYQGVGLLKTSIFEYPENYDPYFDIIKNMPVPDLAGK